MQNSGDMVKANNFFQKNVSLLIKKFYTVPSPFPFLLKKIKKISVLKEAIRWGQAKRDFPDGTVVKNPPANAGEMQVPIPGSGRPLEKEIAPHSSIPAWEIPWTEEPGGLQSTGSHRVRHDEHHHHTETGRCLHQGQTGETQRDV